MFYNFLYIFYSFDLHIASTFIIYKFIHKFLVFNTIYYENLSNIQYLFHSSVITVILMNLICYLPWGWKYTLTPCL